MKSISRRDFVKRSVTASAAMAATTTAMTSDKALGQDRTSEHLKIIGICCSPRKTKTTAASLLVCLEAAKETGSNIETELIELAGLKIQGSIAERTKKNVRNRNT